MTGARAPSGLAYVAGGHDVLAAVRALVDAAERSLVLQMYLFAADGDQTTLVPRPGSFPYAETVAGWLIAKKRARPEATLVVVLDTNTPDDPARTRRRGDLVRHRLERAGVIVLNACLFGARFEPRRRLHPSMNFHLEHGRVPLADWVYRQNNWQVLHNVEDHRKNIVIDEGRAAAITSHNFFDAAFDWHENLFWLTGDVARDAWRVARDAVRAALEIPQRITAGQRAELEALLGAPSSSASATASASVRDPELAPALVEIPAYRAANPEPRRPAPELAHDDPACALVEHAAIRDRTRALFDDAGPGDEVLVATAYFSDLPMLRALEAAADRGARVRVLVDSVEALPLPPALAWLLPRVINHRVVTRCAALEARLGDRFRVRVHASRAGAMMHLKTAARLGRAPRLVGGQANFTPNSFSGAWLETDLETASPTVVAAFAEHFERLWRLEASRPVEPPTRGSSWRALVLDAFERIGLRP